MSNIAWIERTDEIIRCVGVYDSYADAFGDMLSRMTKDMTNHAGISPESMGVRCSGLYRLTGDTGYEFDYRFDGGNDFIRNLFLKNYMGVTLDDLVERGKH